jgi:hypothetical protein
VPRPRGRPRPASARRSSRSPSVVAGPSVGPANLTLNAGGLGLSAALPRWLALHRLDDRS